MSTAPATIKLPDPRRTVALRLAEGSRSVVVLGRPTETNLALVAAFAELGCRSWLADPATLPRVGSSDVVLARLDVLPSLDGIERGLWKLPQLKRAGAQLLNGPVALAAAHDKLSTALFLGRAGVDQPATAHVRDATVPSFGPPYVVKPRFGSWGRDVHLCGDEDELRWRLERLAQRRWFRRQGALVQALIQPTGRDLRVLVAAGRVVGAAERHAAPGEWRTNVSLGAERRRVDPPLAASAIALRAAAAIGIDLAGVDIASDSAGRYYVLEINGAVDFTAAYGDGVFVAASTTLLERASIQAGELLLTPGLAARQSAGVDSPRY
jgi:[lysine-biosynthesis-protein LysW]---L-2-aminoadipate ligase